VHLHSWSIQDSASGVGWSSCQGCWVTSVLQEWFYHPDWSQPQRGAALMRMPMIKVEHTLLRQLHACIPDLKPIPMSNCALYEPAYVIRKFEPFLSALIRAISSISKVPTQISSYKWSISAYKSHKRLIRKVPKQNSWWWSNKSSGWCMYISKIKPNYTDLHRHR
jgi:hypothetical protein